MAGLCFQCGPAHATKSGHLQIFKLRFSCMEKGVDSEVRHSKIPPVMWTESDLLIWNLTNTSLWLIGAENHSSLHPYIQFRGDSTGDGHFVSKVIKIRSLWRKCWHKCWQCYYDMGEDHELMLQLNPPWWRHAAYAHHVWGTLVLSLCYNQLWKGYWQYVWS